MPSQLKRFPHSGQSPGGISYDAAGRITNDGVNRYLYEAQGWLCGVTNNLSGSYATYQYFYDAEGRIATVGKRSDSTCYLYLNQSSPPTSGHTLWDYLYDQAGHRVAAVDGSGNWRYTNVFADGELLATYDNADQKLHYAFNDWLGTKRVQASPSGPGTAAAPNVSVEESCWNLPFNDDSNCSGTSGTDIGNLHYTGKPHDANTGLDLFGARNYAGHYGRFLSPDYNDSDERPEPVPWADLMNPQSLNLYAYVGNNPLSDVDDDGHYAGCDQNPELCRAVRDSVSSGGSIQEGTDAYTQARQKAQQQNQQTTLQKVGTAIDNFMTAGSDFLNNHPLLAIGLTLGLDDQAVEQEGPVIEEEVDSLGNKVEGIVKTIEEDGFQVTANEKSASQEANVTITHPNEPGVKLNLRTETHPIPGSAGRAVRHVNVERIEAGPKNRPVVIRNEHITEQP